MEIVIDKKDIKTTSASKIKIKAEKDSAIISAEIYGFDRLKYKLPSFWGVLYFFILLFCIL